MTCNRNIQKTDDEWMTIIFRGIHGQNQGRATGPVSGTSGSAPARNNYLLQSTSIARLSRYQSPKFRPLLAPSFDTAGYATATDPKTAGYATATDLFLDDRGQLPGLGGGQVELGEAQRPADDVTDVRVEEERHAASAEVTIPVTLACRGTGGGVSVGISECRLEGQFSFVEMEECQSRYRELEAVRPIWRYS